MSQRQGSDGGVGDVVSRELLLLDPAVRSDPHQLRELLHPDCLEFGASGRSFDVDAIIEALAADPSPPSQAPTKLNPVILANNVVLLTYRIEGVHNELRSSLWLRASDSWQLRFHQGTPAPSGT